MSCKIILKVNKNGVQEEIYIGTSPTQITNFNDIKKMLNKLSGVELDEIMNSLPNIEEIEDINIADISENSVGVFSLTELISSLPRAHSNILYKLNLDKDILRKNIVISGFGSSDIRTQFINEHIFLNLNYMYDDDNKTIAAFETALYLSNPDTYKNNIDNLLDNTIESEDKINIISSAFKNGATDQDFQMIKSIYDFVALKKGSDYIAEDLINKRDSMYDFISKFGKDVYLENREINYGPSEIVRIESLKPGDLVEVSFQDVEKGKTKYEVFYDYHVDSSNNIILKTYSTGNTLNNRLLQNNKVSARKYSPEIVTNFTSRREGLVIPISEKLFYTKYKYTYNLIKKYGVAVNGSKIKSLQGSTINLENGNSINISDVKNLTTNKSSMAFNNYTDIGNIPNVLNIKGKLKSIPIDTKIIISENENGKTIFKEGLLIAKGVRRGMNNDDLVYITSDPKNPNKNIVKRVLSNEISYIIPNSDYIVSPEERKSLENIISNVYLHNDISQFISKKDSRLLDFGYSVEQINDDTSYSQGDIIYDFTMGKYFKVIEINNKAIILGSLFVNNIEYIDLKRENIKNSILFTKSPINITFGINHIIKNRFKIDSTKDIGIENVESIKVKKIFQKQNGFIYALTETEEDNYLYKKEDINITETYKKYLSERFNKIIPKSSDLYVYKYINSGNMLHDQNNTKQFNIKNYNLNSFIKFIVPGSFITFEGNAKSFIVEKVIENKLLLSAYHYTNNKIGDNEGLQYVISEKFLLDTDNLGDVKPVSLFVPKWSTKNIENINKIVVKITPKLSKVSNYNPNDSPEVIVAMSNFLENKYGIKINYIGNENIKDFPDINISTAAAFIYNGEIYININKASIEEPLHELLHLVLITLKNSDSDTYYTLVNSIKDHPNFSKISKLYSDDINTEQLEEVFVKLISATFRKNILSSGIFNDETFANAINSAISELLALTLTTENEDPFDLLGNSVAETMTLFGSNLLGAEDGLIDIKGVTNMLEVSGLIKKLINDGNLKEICK